MDLRWIRTGDTDAAVQFFIVAYYLSYSYVKL